MSPPSRLSAPLASWIERWSSILPLLIAEFVVWLGFGALLPVMPLYFREHGVDLQTLGIIIAAWPAARLVGEPIFGWLADRIPRVPLMVAGNIGAGIFQFLPLVFIGAVPFVVLRALQGLSTAVYDPAARGYITDATPPERRGEAFGLYGAAQMGGLLVAAILVNIGANFSAGTYDVVWSIFLSGLGAGLELIGLTFAMFGLPILILSPYFGRRVDRGGLIWYVLIGGLAPALVGVIYPMIGDPALAVPLILIEATGFAMLNPALYAIVAAGSPPGRSSTAQGIFGASGTIGFVVASLVSGGLAEADIRLPFYLFSAVMLVTLVAGLAVGGRALGGVGGGSPAQRAAADAETA